MKNFSELLATDTALNISVILNPISNNDHPNCRLSVNTQRLHSGPLFTEQTFNVKASLLEPVDIKIELYNKIYNAEKETAIKIKSICFDSFELVPNWTQLASYHNDHNVGNPTSYLGFNGIWQLTIDRPFYHWLHKITGQGWLIKPV